MNPSAASSVPVLDRYLLAAQLRWLAEREVYIGTSSWKYEGWLGSIYSPDRYLTRGKFSQARFERDCLYEHGETFSSVCVDAGYYRFPSPKYVEGLMEQTPDHYRFTFKVTDDITARTFPNLPRHGDKAGKRNEHFLNADLFTRAFLTPFAPFKSKVGVLIFEFSHFHARDFERGRDFMDALDQFLGALPKGWRYAVEIRNRNFLHPDYFAMLKSHGVGHAINQWARMPDASEQMAMPGAMDCADFVAARFLLKQGRSFEDAVKLFSPYTAIKEPHEGAREAAAALIRPTVEYDLKPAPKPSRKAIFVYVNNRLEGNSLQTIIAILVRLQLEKHGFLPPSVLPPSSNPPETLL
ncbi:DUF72 domain-containing protein [Verrucomicrobium sp. BvORR106]|uniref:DUF72 domain-containing protein n=1 Tax=Verrucomicrobium sp. BvORR106 TaxID=1403819 RepID=UPI0005703AED|nr:DUF72 domain-containing protein [Verrucomicrobium sp. BvORR106]